MGTNFDNKTHEEMLQWLDHANSHELQAAADRLLSAATEIGKIAAELKVRPQWVEWKGEGADAFRRWSADLANATLRLGDYSKGASHWLSEASNAIVLAQTSTPRANADMKANLEAALGARNDPDAKDVVRQSTETLNADREAAAAQMRRLSQAYTHSTTQMKGLGKPVFPAVPEAIALKDKADRAGGSGQYRRGVAPAVAGGYTGAATRNVRGPESEAVEAIQPKTASVPSMTVHAAPRPVDMEIDSVAVLPDTPSTPSAPPLSPSSGGPADRTPAPVLGGTPPVVRTGPVSPTTNSGRALSGVRPPAPSTGKVGPVTGPTGRLPGGDGIVGGRPASQAVGRPAVGLPRGTVIGNEGTQSGRVPMGHGMGAGSGVIGGQSGMTGGRRLAGEAGGVVGGRSQTSGRTSARPFTPGGTGLVRGAENGGAGGPMGRAGAVTPQRQTDNRREGNERPDYLTEDEETWQHDGRRVVPPVID
ncbi:hypothetical protein ABT218_01730 [Streptomyces sp. NPDC001455]|uniref:hypothetical protein n=1 Tax=Streptomyces sp. NPDC001455 TaxID=3154518 RepID=UPI00331FC79E